MSRYKHYLDIDVVQAARQRIAHVLDTFDHVVVSYSGGKDSLTCLELLRQVRLERGEDLERDPVHAVFLDEELLPRPLIDFVDHYRQQSWLRLHWFGVRMHNTKVILDQVEPIITWDPRRAHVRPLPPWAITAPAGDERVFRQQDMDGFVYETLGLRGKAAFIMGVRSDESLVRYRSVVNKLNENYICASSYRAVHLVKPIYDWSVNDVMKWLAENGVRWCPIYDSQHLAGQQLRVSTPLHGENVRNLSKLKTVDPELFQRLVDLWPDVAVAERYQRDWDREGVAREYMDLGTDEDPFEGCERFIADRLTAGTRQEQLARERLTEYRVLHRNSPASYPPRRLLLAFARGVFHRTMPPETPLDRRRPQRPEGT